LTAGVICLTWIVILITKVGDSAQKAAVQLAAMNFDMRTQRSKRQTKLGDAGETISKVNFDKQMVMIYSDDEAQGNLLRCR
jgi:hypothetical protein